VRNGAIQRQKGVGKCEWFKTFYVLCLKRLEANTLQVKFSFWKALAVLLKLAYCLQPSVLI
jgi:hypothetical protein